MQTLTLDRTPAEMKTDLGHAAQPCVALKHAPSIVPDDATFAVERQRKRLCKVKEDLGRRVLDAWPAPGYRRGEGLAKCRPAESEPGCQAEYQHSSQGQPDLRNDDLPRDTGGREDLAKKRRRKDDVPQKIALGR